MRIIISMFTSRGSQGGSRLTFLGNRNREDRNRLINSVTCGALNGLRAREGGAGSSTLLRFEDLITVGLT